MKFKRNKESLSGGTSTIGKNMELIAEKHYSTQGYKKIWRYVDDLFSSKQFMEDVEELRRIYKIPSGGYKNENPESEIPREWDDITDKPSLGLLMEDVESLCYKYGLPWFDFHDTFTWHVFHGGKPVQFDDFMRCNLCVVDDIAFHKIDPWDESKNESDDFGYPIAVRFSPYATQRDIIDFIEKTYNPFIKELQSRYKMKDIEIGKQRRRDPKKVARNNFIYENRRKGTKVLMKLVGEKYDEFLDEGHISKIISHETNRRNRFFSIESSE